MSPSARAELVLLVLIIFDHNFSPGILCCVHLSGSQLLGHYSLKDLPLDFEYRDPRTVEASKDAADLAERFQPGQDEDAIRKEERARQKASTYYVPSYVSEVKLGKKLNDAKIFDRFDSNFVEPLTETRSNKILPEIQREMTTSRSRYLPGQTNPDIVTQPTRAPDRLVSLDAKIEESERSKTGRVGSVFGFSQQDGKAATFGSSKTEELLSKSFNTGELFKSALNHENPKPTTLSPRQSFERFSSGKFEERHARASTSFFSEK